MVDETDKLAARVAGCRIGSCQRHKDCMYTPCRSLATKDDLVARLLREVPYQGKSRVAFQCHEAADEIETLRAELREVREELARTKRNRDMWKGQCQRQAGVIERTRAALAAWEGQE